MRGWVRIMPAEWQDKQLLLTTSAPEPSNMRSLSALSTLTERGVTPFALTSGAFVDCAAAATSEAPPTCPGVPMARRATHAVIAEAWASALNDRSIDGSHLFMSGDEEPYAFDHIAHEAAGVPAKGLNNRAENSHQPTRRRERIMKRFKSARQAQRFLTVHDQVANLFHIPYPDPSLLTSAALRASELLRSGARFPRLLPLPDSRLSENRLLQLSARLT